jgi:uncharacterized protein YdhG (YjbR/CyaY superfamily)
MMKASIKTPQNIDQYIAGFPKDVQTLLRKVRSTIHKTAPKATEKISYRIPAFFLDGRLLIYFAGFQKHIGMYPAPRSAEGFKAKLLAYAGGKGTVQFPYDQPLPLDLIRRIVQFRAKLNQDMAKAKGTRAVKATPTQTGRKKRTTKR